MKTIICFAFLLLLAFPAASGQQKLFMVVDWHPEHEEALSRLTNEVFSLGRVRLVQFKNGKDRVPEILDTALRPVSLSEIQVYRPADKKQRGEAEVFNLTQNASIETFKKYLSTLVSFESRSISGLSSKENSGNQKVQSWLLEELTRLGYSPALHCYKDYSHGSECNVLAEKQGTESGVILVVAHLDDVGHPNAGADDNASGTAAVLTMAEVLANHPVKKTIRFLFSNGEEAGLNGSRAYARKLESDDQLKEIRFAIAMDMVAYNKNGIFEIETNREFEDHAKWYAGLAQTYTSLTPEITIPAWGSDHVPFLQKGIPTVLTIEDWQTKTPCYHRSCDKEETINSNYAIEIIRVNLAAVASFQD